MSNEDSDEPAQICRLSIIIFVQAVKKNQKAVFFPRLKGQFIQGLKRTWVPIFLVTYDISEEFWSNGLIHIADIDCHLSREFTCLLCRTYNPAKNENVFYSFSFFFLSFL